MFETLSNACNSNPRKCPCCALTFSVQAIARPFSSAVAPTSTCKNTNVHYTISRRRFRLNMRPITFKIR